MKQRLGLANALLTPRELLVLDEPTNGLDPQGTREVRNLIRSLADGGTTVFVSSHLLAEIDQICTHAAIMSNGSLVAQGTLEELRRAGNPGVEVRTPDAGTARRVLASLGLDVDAGTPDAGGPDSGASRDVVVAGHTDEAFAPEEIVAALVDAGVRIRGFTVTSASLEERFVALTGEGFDVAE
jgi:ABC-2 type transport system ATP-binding protein